jgi:predicted DNA-binding transcriptional regulator YafY
VQEIITAIDERRLLTFAYKGSLRVVEPHTYGISGKGVETMCAWQVDGGSGQGFRDFHLELMTGVQVLQPNFPGPRPGYRRGDSTMGNVFSQL